ncbi:MAG TPA: hypothetical protein VED40_14215 [Azospirillaceae bacterium]|nr:hypothetical protein [Azospirillaceae bacterium]
MPAAVGSGMHLVQILLPLYDNDGKDLPRAEYGRVREELVGRFGGLTAYTRAPAEGLWEGGEGRCRDDVVLLEVMVEDLDRAWWATYRQDLARRFRQETILVRAQAVETL